jgi:precorrin-2/cobalt-factor-2 C20-methyltransferase
MREEMKNEERRMKNGERQSGTFFGVGLGPGDPELITLKAVRVLDQVDYIFVPTGKMLGAGVARRIVSALRLPEAKFRPVALCMGWDRGEDLRTYDAIADKIAGELCLGRSAAWIAEGDPLLFSTFLHVYAAMRQRHPQVKIAIVPGVSSPHAAAARAGMPLALLGESVVLMPAAYNVERVPALLDEFASVVLLKVNAVFDRLLDRLASYPREVDAVYLENIGTPEERVVTDLGTLRGQKLPYFSLVLLRKSAACGLTSTCRREREGQA